MFLRNTDLPVPEGPMIALIFPRGTSKVDVLQHRVRAERLRHPTQRDRQHPWIFPGVGYWSFSVVMVLLLAEARAHHLRACDVRRRVCRSTLDASEQPASRPGPHPRRPRRWPPRPAPRSGAPASSTTRSWTRPLTSSMIGPISGLSRRPGSRPMSSTVARCISSDVGSVTTPTATPTPALDRPMSSPTRTARIGEAAGSSEVLAGGDVGR